jgi:predicted amidohydrolase
LIALIAAVAVLFTAWLKWPLPSANQHPSITTQEFGGPSDRALLLVEPALSARDYQSATSLHGALAAYLDEAKARGWITGKTIVVFPEHVGTWLVAAKAPPLAYRASTLTVATISLIADHPVMFAKMLMDSPEQDRSAAAIFRSRSRAMATDYSDVFSSLARDYAATIVAGSIVLENPSIERGEISTRPGALYNVSAVFAPDGSVAPSLIFKRHPIPSEASFTAAGDAPMPVFDMPAGKLGVLICADSWHPELYSELSSAGADAIAVPAFLQGDGEWTRQWTGYVTPTPEDVSPDDYGTLSEGDAWRTYALPGRIGLTGARAGGTAFLHGALWDLGSDGRTLGVAHGGQFIGADNPGGSISVIWY